jgi:predicted DNA-binding transcriptional regulator YafY
MCGRLDPVLATTARLLELLELLQERPVTSGAEIAGRLAVDRRTVRRYVTTLQDLGIPVAGERGAGGGYRLRPGYRLPPLMLTDDEAVAAVLGLAAAQRSGLDITSGGAGRALAKIHRVLPAALRQRVEALEATVGFTTPARPAEPVAGPAVLELAGAIQRRRRVRAGYESSTGDQTGRELSPHGLVVHAGRWYLAAYDHGRGAMRTFRVDRMRHITVTGPAAGPPDGFDAVAYVSRSLARVPWAWQVEVLLHATAEQLRPLLPAALAELTAEGDHTLLRMRVDSLDWMASVLASLECDFTIRAPDELRASVRALAARLTACA